ncbi:PREDICTED: uncharacterized protein LOC105558870 [Vollenhovia emeryi]|uniref:uncharacterized protein LOC105558870 n=1 Tax=Vollenhovia emeryi TaxID=411798 RepID=UPI0005F39370|nr:PREDICTED: uncharacterized protein LOC105558870 [Vollenhovia emeryi]
MANNSEERNNDKQKALDNAISQIEKAFGKGAIMKLKQNPVEKIDTISTGSIALDSALGVGGLPKGRIIEIFGPESSGKTTLALHVIAEAQKKGGSCAFIDAEHALDVLYARKLGVSTDDLVISQPDTGEQALHIVEYLVCSGAVDVIVIDSVAALTPRAEIEGDMGDQHMGLQARLLSHGLRKLTSAVSKANCILIFINQIRMKIGVVYGNPETTTGGNALKFYTSVRLDIRKVGVIKDKENITGNETRVKVVKNKVAPPFREAKFDIMYNEGISKLGEIIDMGAKLGVLEKAGAYYSYNNTRLGQGRENVKTYLKTNKEVANEIETKIRDLLRNHDNSIIIDEDTRAVPNNKDLILSPADGVISKIEEVNYPLSAENGEEKKFTLVSIFLSVLNVHVNRIPISGTIKEMNYKKGKFVSAMSNRSSNENEKQVIVIEYKKGKEIIVEQIAGLIARRIVCNLGVSQNVKAGERFGIIRFGSRVNIYVPADTEVRVSEGQTVIGGTVGLGTISGVAIAITIGGPSAVFWMVITGILGMSIKFAEVVLAFTYRSENATGGAFYYMKYGLAKIGFAKTGGIPFQANQIAALSTNLFEYNASVIISLLVLIVILGGIKRIAFVSTGLAPIMIVLYVAIGGGVLSGLIAGVRRSVFANEAGTGTAAIAHSAVKEEDPIKVGCVAMIAPLIDTILISFLTGIVIIITDMHSTDNVGDITLISSAFMTALSSTVGLGTVAGVAIAVSMGGPGAVPWMMITGFFGMSVKFAEVTLAFRHRTEDQEQLFSGPFQYIRNGLEEFGFKKLGIVLAAIYAVFFVLSGLGGSVAFQTNQMVSILSGYSSWVDGHSWFLSSIISALLALVIIGGIKRIARVSSALVPIMSLIYICSCLVITGFNIHNLGHTFKILFSNMIDFNAVGGGMVGAFVAGIQRAIFASEAGVGSAAITHATTKDEEPVRTGLVAMIEPCFDTMLICCLTGITIVITGAYQTSVGEGILITQKAFETVSSWFPILLTIAAPLFVCEQSSLDPSVTHWDDKKEDARMMESYRNTSFPNTP